MHPYRGYWESTPLGKEGVHEESNKWPRKEGV